MSRFEILYTKYLRKNNKHEIKKRFPGKFRIMKGNYVIMQKIQYKQK